MGSRNIVQMTGDAFGREAGFTKRSGAWYRRQTDTIAVVEFQKSQYGLQYYVNVALWLLALGEEQFPKERTCHVRSRLSDVLTADQATRLVTLLDLDQPLIDSERGDELMNLLRLCLLPLLESCSTLIGLSSPEGRSFLGKSLVTGPARQLLQDRLT